MPDIELDDYLATPGNLYRTLHDQYVRPEDMAGAPTTYANSTDWADAIDAAYADGRPVLFGNHVYYVSRSVGPGRRFAISHFAETTIRPQSGAVATDFTRCVSWQGNAPSTLTLPAGSNLPAPSNVYVLFDVSDSWFSSYSGILKLHGGDLDNFALLSSTNALLVTVWAGGGRSNWSGCFLYLSNAQYGMFSQGRYSDTASTYYPACFVGTLFGSVYIFETVDTPILAADNNFDDTFFSELHISAGGVSYLHETAINFGSVFILGENAATYAFDIQESSLSFVTLYAEGDLLCPIHMNTKAVVTGQLKYGGGAATIFGLRCMVYCDADGGYADLTSHERNMDGEMEALVKLRTPTGVTVPRAIHVGQPYTLAERPAFLHAPQGGDPTGIADSLVSHSSDGVVHYKLESEVLVGYTADVGSAEWNQIFPFDLAFVDDAQDLTSQTTYTFTAHALGAAVTGANVRYTLVALGCAVNNSLATTSVAVGGLAASRVVGTGANQAGAEIWLVDTSSLSTTANIVVVQPALATGMGIATYRMINPGSSTASDTDTLLIHTLGVCTLTLDIPVGGAAIAVVQSRSTGTAPTFTWTGTATPVENYDVDSDAGDAMSGALSTAGSQFTALTFIATSTLTTPTNQRAVAASWGP